VPRTSAEGEHAQISGGQILVLAIGMVRRKVREASAVLCIVERVRATWAVLLVLSCCRPVSICLVCNALPGCWSREYSGTSPVYRQLTEMFVHVKCIPITIGGAVSNEARSPVLKEMSSSSRSSTACRRRHHDSVFSLTQVSASRLIASSAATRMVKPLGLHQSPILLGQRGQVSVRIRLEVAGRQGFESARSRMGRRPCSSGINGGLRVYWG
jgi:hypothetical protein